MVEDQNKIQGIVTNMQTALADQLGAGAAAGAGASGASDVDPAVVVYEPEEEEVEPTVPDPIKALTNKLPIKVTKNINTELWNYLIQTPIKLKSTSLTTRSDLNTTLDEYPKDQLIKNLKKIDGVYDSNINDVKEYLAYTLLDIYNFIYNKFNRDGNNKRIKYNPFFTINLLKLNPDSIEIIKSKKLAELARNLGYGTLAINMVKKNNSQHLTPNVVK